MPSLDDSTLVAIPPLHGNQGDRDDAHSPSGPLGPTIAISREAGARGETIARRVGKKLGWDVYTREHLEFLSSNENARSEITNDIPKKAQAWYEKYLYRLEREGMTNSSEKPYPIASLILALACRGNLLIVGRAAGYLLPKRTTLHVRIVAPLDNRIAYMAQYLRMNKTDAADQVRKRDERRIEFLSQHNRRDGQQYDFDLVLNSAELGEELCAELIVHALKAKQKQFETEK
ncbi:cytidylate kinase-like family protein [Telmatocola sphagniphila]|uniref:Cytidylate kinase-like family protein n=1 Tax=Telmatocola sphagniphila TaxID=1123043 RepID=A0A8E6EYI2_9BACT|nr:cytidylate kinase-like family protein [Telmatocola sphagniphila]QVL32396.1 cytidylate kinase-like family protein [Telmatocola sphagniphila]